MAQREEVIESRRHFGLSFKVKINRKTYKDIPLNLISVFKVYVSYDS